MGLLDLFSRNDSDVFSVSYIGKMRKQLERSFNYQFVFKAVKDSFLGMDFEKLYKNEINTRNFLNGCADYVVRRGLPRDNRFYNLKFYYANNEEGDRSIIVELKGPWTIETECNYIGLFKKTDGAQGIFTSEYYASTQTFGLSEETIDSRYNLSGTGSIRDLQSFQRAINQTVI